MTDDFGGQNGENLPGYTTTNVRLEWNGIAESGFDMAVYVRNLFGERFFTSPAVLLANFPTSSAYVGALGVWGVAGRYRYLHPGRWGAADMPCCLTGCSVPA